MFAIGASIPATLQCDINKRKFGKSAMGTLAGCQDFELWVSLDLRKSDASERVVGNLIILTNAEALLEPMGELSECHWPFFFPEFPKKEMGWPILTGRDRYTSGVDVGSVDKWVAFRTQDLRIGSSFCAQKGE